MSRQEPSIPPAMEQYLQTQIEADERVLWASTSDFSERMRRIRFMPVISIVMMVFCSAFSWSNPDRWLMVLLSVLFWGGLPVLANWSMTRHLRRRLYAITDQRALISGETRFIILTGFMGAFTTFATFAFETGQFLRDAQWFAAGGNLSLQNVVGISALLLGFAVGRWF